jgi:hypothetical protein
MKGHDMTQNNTFPPRLINGFKKLADDFEAHIRADERSRIAKKFADAFPSKPVAKPGLFPITDMHGEPLQEIGAQPVPYDHLGKGLESCNLIFSHTRAATVMKTSQ